MNKSASMLKIASACIVFSFPCLLFSQIKIHKAITVKDGLVHPAVACMFQDSRGFLWIGTNGGVSRWDGSNWHNFQTQDGLPGAAVRQILEDERGNLVVATAGGVAFIQDNEIVRTLTTTDGLAHNNVLSMHQAEDGALYFGTWGGGVSVFRNRTFVKTIDESDGLCNNVVMKILEPREGVLLFATWGGGASRYQNGRFLEPLTEKQGLVNDHCWDVQTGANGELYFGTWGGLGIHRNGEFVSATMPGQENFDIYAIHESRRGKLYLATSQGVYAYQNRKLVPEITAEHGLADASIRCFFEDKLGTLYLGTDNGGIAVHKPGLFTSLNQQTGLDGNVVTALYQDDSGLLYVGTRDHGVNLVRDAKVVGRFNVENEVLAANSVRAITADNSGRIFVGTFAGGVAVIENGNLSKTLNLRNGLRTNRVTDVLVANDGALYVGAWQEGVTIYKNLQFHTTLDSTNGLQGDVITELYEGTDGVIYIACSGFGVNRYCENAFLDAITAVRGLPSNSVTSIHQSTEGALFFGTWGAGLAVQRQDTSFTIDVRDGLSNNIVRGIVEDDSGRIYISTANGVNILSLDDRPDRIRVLNSEDGLIDDTGSGAILKDRRGKLWFGTVAGVSRYDPDFDIANPKPPRIHFSGVHLFNKPLALWHAGQQRRFKHGQNSFTFEFVGINLPAPHRVMYRYRLSGIDRNWVRSWDSSVQYTSLGPGAYRFEVKASNESGVWSEPTSLAFVIEPPFWQSWWFRTLLIAAVFRLAWLAYRMRVSRLLALEQLRTRIASDLHDDIGATLTHIALGSETILNTREPEAIKRTARKIGQLSREVTQTFSDIVWSIDARNDSTSDLLDRMKDFAYQTLAPHEIEYSFHLEGFAKEKTLPVNLRQNIYLIFKEAITNTVKHANAKTVRINIANHKHGFCMIIEDDGIGLTSADRQDGNGLKNMRFRAQRIGGELGIESDAGVRIALRRPAL